MIRTKLVAIPKTQTTPASQYDSLWQRLTEAHKRGRAVAFEGEGVSADCIKQALFQRHRQHGKGLTLHTHKNEKTFVAWLDRKPRFWDRNRTIDPKGPVPTTTDSPIHAAEPRVGTRAWYRARAQRIAAERFGNKRTWVRLQALLQRGPLKVVRAAHRLRVPYPYVNSAILDHPDVFERIGKPGAFVVCLRRSSSWPKTPGGPKR